MPNPLLSTKYKGKAFGDISKTIEGKYKDRFDPISRRGLMAEMSSLREAQEFEREKVAARENLQQQLQAVQQQQQMQQDPMLQQQQMDPMQMQQQQMQPQIQPNVTAPNMGVAPEMPQQDMGQFQHSASQGYNQQFMYGGSMDYFNGGPFGDEHNYYIDGGVGQATKGLPNLNNILQAAQRVGQGVQAQPQAFSGFNLINSGIAPEQSSYAFDRNTSIPRPAISTALPNLTKGAIKTGLQSNVPPPSNNENFNTRRDMLRFAPIATTMMGLLSARRAPSIQGEVAKMGYPTMIDQSLASRISPRQTQFGNVDMSQIERGITDQAKGFTGTNTNMSGGQSGMFMANELANQGNVMNAIGNARMQAQGQDRQTAAMNAQEQARIDQFLQGQASQRAGIQAQNVGIGTQFADINMRNRMAFDAGRYNMLSNVGQNLSNIGTETDRMRMIANSLGYDSFGNYVEAMKGKESDPTFKSLMNLLGFRKNTGAKKGTKSKE